MGGKVNRIAVLFLLLSSRCEFLWELQEQRESERTAAEVAEAKGKRISPLLETYKSPNSRMKATKVKTERENSQQDVPDAEFCNFLETTFVVIEDTSTSNVITKS